MTALRGSATGSAESPIKRRPALPRTAPGRSLPTPVPLPPPLPSPRPAFLCPLRSAKDLELGRLRGQLAEREGKLRAARSDLLEVRMAAQEKDAALAEAYDKLASACQERSRLRGELVHTQGELAETRAELEALADDILSIRDLMDSIDGEDEAAAAAGAESLPAGSVPGEGEEALDVLQNLAAFSRQMLSDAAEDADVYAMASKLAAADEAWRGGGEQPGAPQ